MDKRREKSTFGISYGEITAEKHGLIWIAKTYTTLPFRAEVSKTGKTEQDAKDNLRKWLDEK